jgi:SAM-dependent methyltransferase
MTDKKYNEIVSHYEACLEKHGDTHLGVDWPKLEDAEKRYVVMLDVIKFHQNKSKSHSLLDFGCGTAMLLEYLIKNKIESIKYAGLDISPKFIDVCVTKFPEYTFFCEDLMDHTAQIPYFDYIVLNGVFTEKRGLSFEEMFNYFEELLTNVFAKANCGIAFNVMSKSVDWERDDLFHLSADKLIDFITKKLSRNFIIRNDYGLYEYTTYIYK